MLEARGISAVPILENGKLVGIVSTTDIVAATARVAATANPVPAAAELMTSPVVTVTPDEPLLDASRKMVAAKVHRVVVIDHDRVVGMLSARDVLKEVKARLVDTPIGKLMTTPVLTVEVGSSVDEAIAKLAAANVHGLVVVDATWPIGVFTHAEAMAARSLPPSLRGLSVERVMSYETVCLDVATPVHRAASYLVAMNVRRILVVEKRDLVGIMSCLDLVACLTPSVEG